MQPRPPRFGCVVFFDAVTGVARSNCCNQRGIQPARQQHAVRHVGHQLAVHGTLEGLAQFLQLHLHAFHFGIFAPGAFVVTAQHPGGAVVPMTRRELRRVGAIVHQRFQFRCHPQAAFAVVPPVQRHHTDRVARDDHPPFRLVPQRERKDAVEAVEIRGRRIFAIQRIDHLAIGAGLEGVRVQQFGLEFAMVVDLAIDRQGELPVFG